MRTQVTLHLGDALALPLPDASVDAIVTDPPYGLEFMGVAWDTMRDDGKARARNEWGDFGSREHARHPSEVAGIQRKKNLSFYEFSAAWAAEAYRVLKPGGFMLAFGGTRTVHRLTSAIEDAGFEIRDGITWLYGSGFPKSLDVSKAIDKAAGAEREMVGLSPHSGNRAASTFQADDTAHGYVGRAEGERTVTAPATDAASQWEGWGTALKPAHEPIVVARKPLVGTVAANVLAHGTGALNIDGCRVAWDGPPPTIGTPGWGGPRKKLGAVPNGGGETVDRTPPNAAGRWPSNVVFTHASDCGEACTPDCPVAELDAQSGVSTSSGGSGAASRGALGKNGVYGKFANDRTDMAHSGGVGDSGGASRFFPVFRYQAKAPARERPKVNGVGHPTVKPLALMRWLVRLVTPPGGVVLDQFAGSGTTVEAAILEGFSVIGVEQDPTYLPLIEARIDRVKGVKK